MSPMATVLAVTPERGNLEGQAAGEGECSSLPGAVGGDANRDARRCGARGDRDDPAPPALAHVADDGMATVQDTIEVDANRSFPVAGFHFDESLYGHWLGSAVAGVVDENVNGLHRGHGVLDCRQVGDIEGQRPRSATRGSDGFSNGTGSLGHNVIYEHCGTSTRQSSRDARTDALARPCHQRNAPLEVKEPTRHRCVAEAARNVAALEGSGSRGRPSTRSLMVLRRICSVAPPRRIDLWERNCFCQDRELGVAATPSRPAGASSGKRRSTRAPMCREKISFIMGLWVLVADPGGSQSARDNHGSAPRRNQSTSRRMWRPVSVALPARRACRSSN